MRTTAAVLSKGTRTTYYDWDFTQGDGKCIVLVPVTIERRRGPRVEHDTPVLILAHPDGSVAVHVDETEANARGGYQLISAAIRDFNLDEGMSDGDVEAQGEQDPQQQSRDRAHRLMTYLSSYVL